MGWFEDLLGIGSSANTTTTTQTPSVPPDVEAARRDLLGRAQAFAAEPYSPYVMRRPGMGGGPVNMGPGSGGAPMAGPVNMGPESGGGMNRYLPPEMKPGGGDTFQADASSAAGDVLAYGNENADLMSRIDAPIDQRIGESTSFGNLGIDLDTVAREAQGRHFLDQLRANSIRRNPWIDAGSQVLSGLGGSMIGGGAVSGGATNGAPSLSAYTGAMKNSGASGFGFGNMANAGKIVGLPPR